MTISKVATIVDHSFPFTCIHPRWSWENFENDHTQYDDDERENVKRGELENISVKQNQEFCSFLKQNEREKVLRFRKLWGHGINDMVMTSLLGYYCPASENLIAVLAVPPKWW